MNDLCVDVGYKSVNHFGEQLCGDHVDVVEEGENSSVVVLADGLGSGVKASILSTLTAKIISTMMAEGLSVEDCVSTIAATLPVCSVRGVAYSTFTIVHIVNDETAQIIEFDNPQVIMIRDGALYDYPRRETSVGGKTIYQSSVSLRDGASLIARLLFEEATDINFYVGRAVNPAHQNPDLPINFNIKMNLVSELSECLKKMGKRIKVSYF